MTNARVTHDDIVGEYRDTDVDINDKFIYLFKDGPTIFDIPSIFENCLTKCWNSWKTLWRKSTGPVKIHCFFLQCPKSTYRSKLSNTTFFLDKWFFCHIDKSLTFSKWEWKYLFVRRDQFEIMIFFSRREKRDWDL